MDQYQEDSITSSDNERDIPYKSWLSRASEVVVIACHGCFEHSQRYEQLGGFLAGEGIDLWSLDAEGHGVSEYEAGENAWHKRQQDISDLVSYIKKYYRPKHIFFIGNDIGSYHAIQFSSLRPELVDGIILCGWGFINNLRLNMLSALLRAECLFFPDQEDSRVAEKLIKSHFEKYAGEGHDLFLWLSHDIAVVRAILSDPLFRQNYSPDYWLDIVQGIAMVQKQVLPAFSDCHIPALILSGEQDAVTFFGINSGALADKLNAGGDVNVENKIIPGFKHNLIDTQNDLFYDILNWIRKYAYS